MAAWKGKSIRHSSACTLSGEDRRDGPRQNLGVRPKALTFDVVDIELHLAGKINFRPAADLPDASNSRLDGQAAPLRQGIFCHLARHRRARSNQGHIADENVEKLGQLIKRKLSQPAAHPGDAWIVLDLESNAFLVTILIEQFSQSLLGIEAHRSDFVHLELAAVPADPGLRKE